MPSPKRAGLIQQTCHALAAAAIHRLQLPKEFLLIFLQACSQGPLIQVAFGLGLVPPGDPDHQGLLGGIMQHHLPLNQGRAQCLGGRGGDKAGITTQNGGANGAVANNVQVAGGKAVVKQQQTPGGR